MPGPLVAVTRACRRGGPERHVGGGELVLSPDGADAEAVVAGEVVEQFEPA